MAVGWKTLAGIVGAASVVSVGALYSVLVRTPSLPNVPAQQSDAADAKKGGGNAPSANSVSSSNPGASTSAGDNKPGGKEAPPPSQKTASSEPAGTQQKEAKPAAAGSQPPAAPVKPAPPPTFDVVRIEPNGDAVVAGQGAPGATVELLRNGMPFARAVADVGGQWAIVPTSQLPKGTCELTLRVTTPDGRIMLSQQAVTVRVPQGAGEEVVILLNAPDQPSRVLTDGAKPSAHNGAGTQPAPSSQAGVNAPAASGGGSGKAPSRASTAIRTVEADETGRFFVTGTGEPGATIRIYLNDTPVATVTVAKDGTFGMTVEKGMLPGDYTVRADDVVSGSGQVLTRAEVPFVMADKTPEKVMPAVVAANPPAKSAEPVETEGSPKTPPADVPSGDTASETTPGGSATTAPAPPAQPGPPPSVAVIPEIKTMTIVKGDNLWRISRKVYGQGIRYTWIYDANSAQIRDPDLIYPGQIFVMPEKKAP